MWEQETFLYCPTLCHCFLSPLLLSISRTTSSSTSSPYSDKHNKVPSASACLPCSSSGICALHKYLFSSMVVLYWKRGREGGRVCPHRCMCYCFLLLIWDLGPCDGPPLGLGSTHPALNALPFSHHASFCPTSLLFCHRPLFVLSLCFISPLRALSLSRTHAAYVPFSPSSYLLTFLLCVSVYVSS